MTDEDQEPTDEEVARAAERVAQLADSIITVLDTHADQYEESEGERNVGADMRVAVLVVLGRVAEATGWEPMDALSEVATVLGMDIAMVGTLPKTDWRGAVVSGKFRPTAWRRDPWVPGKRYDVQLEERGDALFAENHRLRAKLAAVSSILDEWEEAGCHGGPDELAALREASRLDNLENKGEL